MPPIFERFERRYQAILVTDEERAHVERLAYILHHGAKENLVARPSEWSGPHCAEALRTGEPMHGVWVSRTAQWVARNRGQQLSDQQASIPYELRLEPLPCWRHLSPERYRRLIAEILRQIDEETALRHEREGTAPLGVAEIFAQHPHATPSKLKRAPAPLVHAASRKMRREFYALYAAFVGAFYEAVERLKDGCRTPGFPDGAFPPALPLSLASPG